MQVALLLISIVVGCVFFVFNFHYYHRLRNLAINQYSSLKHKRIMITFHHLFKLGLQNWINYNISTLLGCISLVTTSYLPERKTTSNSNFGVQLPLIIETSHHKQGKGLVAIHTSSFLSLATRAVHNIFLAGGQTQLSRAKILRHARKSLTTPTKSLLGQVFEEASRYWARFCRWMLEFRPIKLHY